MSFRSFTLSCVTGLLLAGPGTLEAQTAPKDLRVTYVGNAGFLVQVGKKKILLDGLFQGFQGAYVLPREVQDKLATAQAPFDGIDLILATHTHGDHFSPEMVGNYLKNNPKTRFGGTRQATALLTNFPEQTVGFEAGEGKTDQKVVAGIQVEAIYLSHGIPAPGETEIVNYGYVVSVDGVSFFHSGDIDPSQISFETFRSYRLPEKHLDLAFIQHYCLGEAPSDRRLVQEGIAAMRIFPSHYHLTNPPLQRDAILRSYPEAILFEKELETWSLPEDGTLRNTLLGGWQVRETRGGFEVYFLGGAKAGTLLMGHHGLSCAYAIQDGAFSWTARPNPKFSFTYRGTLVGTDRLAGTYESSDGEKGQWTATRTSPALPLLGVGSEAPPLRVGRWLKGNPLTHLEKGQVHVVVFWSAGDPLSERSIPRISSLAKTYAGRAEFLGVDIWNVDSDDTAKVDAFMVKLAPYFTFRVCEDAHGDDMAMAWLWASGRNGTPTATIVDRSGRIAWMGRPEPIGEALERILNRPPAAKKGLSPMRLRVPSPVFGQADRASRVRAVTTFAVTPWARPASPAGPARSTPGARWPRGARLHRPAPPCFRSRPGRPGLSGPCRPRGPAAPR